MKSYYSFDDIFLIPKFTDCFSRSDLSTSVEIGDFSLKIPVISANMDTITGPAMATEMWGLGAVGALHRFSTIDENLKMYEKITDSNANCFVSIGVNGDSIDRARTLYSAGARHFIIDIAHGHSEMMRTALRDLRKYFKSKIYIVAGNVATPDAVNDLASWGADCVKVGIGAGSCCKTRVVTGHGVPMFSCLLECCAQADIQGVKVIADGGIRGSGDAVKAFAAGSDLVMIGSLLAGSIETPGKMVSTKDGVMKEFRGMASQEAMRSRYGSTRTNLPTDEGVGTYVKSKGPVNQIIINLKKGIQSGMSYCGAKQLSEISIKSQWGVQTFSGLYEGTPHILAKS